MLTDHHKSGAVEKQVSEPLTPPINCYPSLIAVVMMIILMMLVLLNE